jgi:uncharacterized protein YcbK (DUF882 family)
MRPDPRPHRPRGNGIRPGLCLAAAAGLSTLAAGIGGFESARASADVRTLTIFHTHTKEAATVTFWRDGRFDEAGLAQLNRLLRDWRVNETAKMDPQLFHILWEIYRETGAREPINIISAYRSPVTNAMLRNRSKGVSEHSQHMLGKAMDIRLPDVDSARLRAVAMRMQYGGVGYYSSSDFVHVDVGNVRAWPRMSQDQLARLFPDGKTVHLPPSGKPLARYEEARAEIQVRKQALASAAGANPLGSLLGGLFRKAPPAAEDGSAVQQTAVAQAQVAPSPEGAAAPRMALAAPLPPPRPVLLAYAARPDVSQTADASAHASARPALRPLTPESRLLFSGVAIGADRARPAAPAMGGSARWLDRALLVAEAPILAQTFSERPTSLSATGRFTGRAVPPLPAWRVAHSTL